MSQFNTFQELAQDTRNKILEFGTTSVTVFRYFDRCVQVLEQEFQNEGVIFSIYSALQWLNEHKAKMSRQVYLSYRRCILLLNDNYSDLLTEWKTYPIKEGRKLQSDEFLKVMEFYEDFLKNQEYKKSTIDFKMRCARKYLFFQEDLGISKLEDIDFQSSAAYFNSSVFDDRKPSGVQAYWNRTRHFLEFLEERNCIDLKLSHSVPVWTASHKSIPTPLSSEVQSALLQDYPGFKANKRDKAMYQLALDTGLRWIDIKSIRFPDIDWKNREISITQQKTGTPHTVYLTDKAADALIDYILNERRECDLDLVFITAQGPIKGLEDDHRCNTRWRLKHSAPDLKVPSYGSHVMRDTFASNLFAKGGTVEDVYISLGHTDPENVHRYLSIKEDEMKECALELDLAPYTGGLY